MSAEQYKLCLSLGGIVPDKVNNNNSIAVTKERTYSYIFISCTNNYITLSIKLQLNPLTVNKHILY